MHVDWNKVSEAACAIVVSAKSTGYSDTFNPTKKCIYDLKKIAKQFGYRLVKERSVKFNRDGTYQLNTKERGK